MCGIAGIWARWGVDDRDCRIVRKMMTVLKHRGPDGHGTWARGRVVFGQRRLAVIDIEGGRQPFFNEAGDIAVIYNGEVYNFRELRRLLSSCGHTFQSRCDTEVLVHGWEEWETGLFERLRGMFALAIHDTRKDRLVLARDRLGIKPLYYTWLDGGDRLLFGSEIKAIVQDPRVSRSLNRSRLGEYLMFRSVAGSETLFDWVHEISPAHWIEVRPSGAERENSYWNPAVPVVEDEPLRQDQVEHLAELFTNAVSVRLASDVALGTITSGGLDSSAVSVVAATESEARIDTFCAGFPDPRLDERQYAREVSREIGSTHHEVEVNADRMSEELSRLTWAHDEPLNHPNSIPMHLVFRAAKEDHGVTVLLSGEGADEIFGGYDRYRVMHRRQQIRRLPFARLFASLVPTARGRTLRYVLDKDYGIYASALLRPGRVRSVGSLKPDLARRFALWPSGRSDPDALFVYDQMTYLPSLLQRQDRMSMAAGVEARVPFLDHHLVEWANALPFGTKVLNGRPKALLREAARRWVPKSTVDREKVGFTLPLAEWMRGGGVLTDRIRALGDSNSFVCEFIPVHDVRRLIEEHEAAASDHSTMLWTLLSLEVWAELYLGASPRAHRLPGAPLGRQAAL